ncbi:MAG: SDR family NAD(P)-dependent oxidoreductase [Promethearchaeota archaeon]
MKNIFKIKKFMEGWNDLGFAVITGASSGLGKQFALALGGCGLNTILVARRKEKLKELADELTEKYGTINEIYQADLADIQQVEELAQFLSQRADIDMLINNAGFGTRGLFYEVAPYKHVNMTMIHVVVPTRLIRAVLPNLIKKNRGAIINVASLASFVNYSGSALYSATKRYLVEFSKAIKVEIANTNIKIQALCPGYTYTEFHSVGDYVGYKRSKIPKFMWMKADKVIEISLKKLAKNRVVIIAGGKNKFFKGLMSTPLIGSIIKKMVSSKIKKDQIT